MSSKLTIWISVECYPKDLASATTGEALTKEQVAQKRKMQGKILVERGAKYPCVCLFTSLDFATIKTFDVYGLDTNNSNRPFHFVNLTPGGPLLLDRIKTMLEYMDSTGLLATYFVSVTSSHWRALKEMLLAASQALSRKGKSTLSEKLSFSIRTFERVLGL